MGARASKNASPPNSGNLVPASTTVQTAIGDALPEQTLFDEDALYASAVADAAAAGLRIRPLRRSDYGSGHLDLLMQLTVTGEVSERQYAERFDLLKSVPNTYFVVVIEDMQTHKLVATGSVFIEHKFTHACGTVGHIEDIVTTKERRGQQLGRRVIEQLKHICQSRGCYKVILDTSEANTGFYEHLGFQRKEHQMALYF